jgi:hypothetical protein
VSFFPLRLLPFQAAELILQLHDALVLKLQHTILFLAGFLLNLSLDQFDPGQKPSGKQHVTSISQILALDQESGASNDVRYNLWTTLPSFQGGARPGQTVGGEGKRNWHDDYNDVGEA